MTNLETWRFVDRRQREGAVSPRFEHAEKRKGISGKTSAGNASSEELCIRTEDLQDLQPWDSTHGPNQPRRTQKCDERFSTKISPKYQDYRIRTDSPLDPDRKQPEKHIPTLVSLAARTNQSNQAPTPPETPREKLTSAPRAPDPDSGAPSSACATSSGDESEGRGSSSRSRVPRPVPSPATRRWRVGGGGEAGVKRDGYSEGGAKPKRWGGK
jgi:hypothetical protein